MSRLTIGIYSCPGDPVNEKTKWLLRTYLLLSGAWRRPVGRVASTCRARGVDLSGAWRRPVGRVASTCRARGVDLSGAWRGPVVDLSGAWRRPAICSASVHCSILRAPVDGFMQL